ncbi:unnamed protein product [Vitrella brassicaformis CCMP3155]|uniref:B-related factor 1 n=3 Tax=Vitrella brassicaformis TaxID=1169539 RepID=A0A0G4F322_VITBC|nr:unnamed protein product [Vitrella brassicaformis CCMP3155]|eukprot:CEM05943.1 unnamed protein product [Vitrella brassicaformis CCMP3155]
MSASACVHCGCVELDYSTSRGDLTCTNCGAVLEENAVVNEVSFGESSSGAVHVVGQFVSASGSRPFSSSIGAFGQRDQRQATLERGYRRIQQVAGQLRLPQSFIETANRLFMLANQRNFTKGRRTRHVAAACLYTVCRQQEAPQMLIDFADVLETPVKNLGQIFMKLIRLLRVSIPLIDPSFFMERFASRLPMDNDMDSQKVHKVAATATRLIQAMKRDWICTGRRPTGLCGAALLISARYHGHKIAADDIAKVVRISGTTIRKRLYEFRKTPTARLTREQFEVTDLQQLPIETLPPCLKSDHLKREEGKLEAIKDEDDPGQLTLEGGAAVQPLAVMDGNGPFPPSVKAEASLSGVAPADGEGDLFDEGANDEGVGPPSSASAASFGPVRVKGERGPSTTTGVAPGSVQLQVDALRLSGDNPSAADIDEIAKSVSQALEAASVSGTGRRRVRSSHPSSSKPPKQEEPLLGAGLTDLLDQLLATTDKADDRQPADGDDAAWGEVYEEKDEVVDEEVQGEGGQRRGQRRAVRQRIKRDTDIDGDEGEEQDDDEMGGVAGASSVRTDVVETLSDVGSDEIAGEILTAAERQAKEAVWQEITKDYWEQWEASQEHKRKKKREHTDRVRAELRKQGLPATDKDVEAAIAAKRRKTAGASYPEAESAAHSVQMALERNARGMSAKVNVSTLESLFGPGSGEPIAYE